MYRHNEKLRVYLFDSYTTLPQKANLLFPMYLVITSALISAGEQHHSPPCIGPAAIAHTSVSTVIIATDIGRGIQSYTRAGQEEATASTDLGPVQAWSY